MPAAVEAVTVAVAFNASFMAIVTLYPLESPPEAALEVIVKSPATPEPPVAATPGTAATAATAGTAAIAGVPAVAKESASLAQLEPVLKVKGQTLRLTTVPTGAGLPLESVTIIDIS